MRTGGTHSEFWGPKFILYNHSHVAYQNKGYEEQNTVVQKRHAPGVCLGVTRGQKVGFWVLIGFLARTLKLSQIIALWMRTGGKYSKF